MALCVITPYPDKNQVWASINYGKYVLDYSIYRNSRKLTEIDGNSRFDFVHILWRLQTVEFSTHENDFA